MTEPARPGQAPASGRRWLRFLLLLAAGLALFALLISFSGASSLKRLTRLRPLPLVLGFLSTIGITGAVALRWGILTNELAGRRAASWSQYYRYVVWSRALGFLVPKDLTDLGGRTVALTARHEMPWPRAGAAVLLDRGLDVLALLLFLGPSLLFLFGIVEAGVGVGLMVLMAVGFYALLRLGHRKLLTFVGNVYNSGVGLLRRFPRVKLQSLGTMEPLSLSLDTLTRAYLLGLCKFLFTSLRYVSFAAALDMPVPSVAFLLTTPIGQLSFLFAFTPGGLGILEAGWYAVLVLMGVDELHIAPFLVEQRVFTVLFVGILALLSSFLSPLESSSQTG